MKITIELDMENNQDAMAFWLIKRVKTEKHVVLMNRDQADVFLKLVEGIQDDTLYRHEYTLTRVKALETLKEMFCRD